MKVQPMEPLARSTGTMTTTAKNRRDSRPVNVAAYLLDAGFVPVILLVLMSVRVKANPASDLPTAPERLQTVPAAIIALPDAPDPDSRENQDTLTTAWKGTDCV